MSAACSIKNKSQSSSRCYSQTFMLPKAEVDSEIAATPDCTLQWRPSRSIAFLLQPCVACKGKPANPTPTFYGCLLLARLGAPPLWFSGEASMFTQSDATRGKAKTYVLRHTVRSSRSSPLHILVACVPRFLKTPYACLCLRKTCQMRHKGTNSNHQLPHLPTKTASKSTKCPYLHLKSLSPESASPSRPDLSFSPTWGPFHFS